MAVCAVCLLDKPTPLRRDDMGGYVCLHCVDQRLTALTKERDAMAKVIDPDEDDRPALMARIIMRSIENKTNAEEWERRFWAMDGHFDKERARAEAAESENKALRETAAGRLTWAANTHPEPAKAGLLRQWADEARNATEAHP